MLTSNSASVRAEEHQRVMVATDGQAGCGQHEHHKPNGGVESDQLAIPPPEVMEALAVTKLSDPQRSVDVDQLVVARWRASTDIDVRLKRLHRPGRIAGSSGVFA